MAIVGNTANFLPPARHLQQENLLVQEYIRKTLHKQDFGKSLKAQLEHKHAQRRQKIIVVANRLPTKVKTETDASGNKTFTFEKCSGGLVSCLASLPQFFEMVWIGWAGAEVPEDQQASVAEEAMKQNCYPVFLSQELITDYYNGFANNVLWPLFHYIMPPYDKGVNECSTDQWEAYKTANEKFVEAILRVHEDDDYVWVHDYHLMLVPKFMREQKPDCNIGWFLHTPFPSAEVYRTLPWRQEIIESLLHANLLGFHVYDYLRHFLSSCVQLTSLEISAHTVDATSIGGCIVTCATVPIGITPTDFSDCLSLPEVEDQIKTLIDQYGDRKVILGIDRLDYMKGIPHKLMAFDAFLEEHPWYVGKCVLVQLAVPSRRDVPEYQRLQRQVHELVGQICGRHSKVDKGTPVIYLDQSMSHNDLTALYHVADVALITSLRDGMNLVSYEYIAYQLGKEVPGVLVLSEFAGAAQSLGAGSIRINPWNVQDTATALYEALELPGHERIALHKYAYEYITEHTAQKWAETFLQCLQEASSDVMEVTAEVPPLLPFEELLADWAESTKRLIIIDILECLVPPKRRHGMTRKRASHGLVLPSDLEKCLEIIAQFPDTTVIITADKSRQELEMVCGSLPVILAPEGCCVCRDLKGEWRSMVEDAGNDAQEWMGGVKAVFDYFRERTPGSYIERQDLLIRWYWEDTQTDFGSAQAREVLIHLWAGPLVNSEAEVVVGDRSITVRPHSCSRSACLEKLLQEEIGEDVMQQVDFALCFAVVSHRDEDMFESLINLLGYSGMPLGYGCMPILPSELPGGLPTLPEARKEGSDTELCGSDTPLSGPRKLSSDMSNMSELDLTGEQALRTPRGPVPQPQPGELPPPYDWIPTAQRERNEQLTHQPSSVTTSPAAEIRATPEGEFEASCCACYTLSLGMRKTKAQHMLPHPYHVQNLIRAMERHLPRNQVTEEQPDTPATK